MSCAFFGYTINSTTPFTPSSNPDDYLGSTDGFVGIRNVGPEIIYVGLVFKDDPVVITYVEHDFTIYPGEYLHLPADTDESSVRLGFNTTDEGGTSNILITVGS